MKQFVRILLILCMLNLFTNMAFATNFSKITPDKKIKNALELLESSGSNQVIKEVMGDNLSNRPVKIKFYPLESLSFSYKDVHALATSDNYGNMYILINPKHRRAPDAAIASLIAHEMTHQLKETTLEEEVRAWTNEVTQWIKLKKQNPTLVNQSDYNCELVQRLNRLEYMYKLANNTPRLFAKEITSNERYMALKVE